MQLQKMKYVVTARHPRTQPQKQTPQPHLNLLRTCALRTPDLTIYFIYECKYILSTW